MTKDGSIRLSLIPRANHEVIARVDALRNRSEHSNKFTTVFSTSSSLARVADGPFQSQTVDGNFNVSGWMPSTVSLNHTALSCGHNASGI